MLIFFSSKVLKNNDMANEVKKVLNEKVGNLTLVDGFLITASKITSEEILSKVPYIGNGTYKSGGIKLGGALLLSFIKNKYVSYIAQGLLIDGAEDIIANLKGLSQAKSEEVIL